MPDVNMTAWPSCRGLAGMIFGHNFDGRWSTKDQQYGYNASFMQGFAIESKGQPLPDVHERTYHGDVCSRCGKTVNTQPAS